MTSLPNFSNMVPMLAPETVFKLCYELNEDPAKKKTGSLVTLIPPRSSRLVYVMPLASLDIFYLLTYCLLP